MTVNGVELECDEGSTVNAVVASLVTNIKGVAVSVNREVVPRSAWEATVLLEGSRVEVLTAAAGG